MMPPIIGTLAALRIDLVGTTADFRRPGPRRPLPLNHLPGENCQTMGRIGEVRLVALDRVKLAPTPVFRQPFGVVVIKTVVSALHPRPVQPNPNPIKSRPTRQRVAAASSIDYGHKI